jgi:hypothetical protein
MRLMICVSSLALLGGAAFADDVRVAPVVPVPGVVIEHRSADTDVNKKVITRDQDGCKTKTVKKTDGDGDTSTHTKTNC